MSATARHDVKYFLFRNRTASLPLAKLVSLLELQIYVSRNMFDFFYIPNSDRFTGRNTLILHIIIKFYAKSYIAYLIFIAFKIFL